MTHSDLASLSVAVRSDPGDEDLRGRYHQALCRIFGHLDLWGLSVGKVTDDGLLGSYCHGGCHVCQRCNQVTCAHASNYPERKLGTNPFYEMPGRGMAADWVAVSACCPGAAYLPGSTCGEELSYEVRREDWDEAHPEGTGRVVYSEVDCEACEAQHREHLLATRRSS